MSYCNLCGLFADESINDLLKISGLSSVSPEPTMQRLHAAIENYCRQPLGTDITPKSLDYFLGLSGKPGQSLATTQIRYKTRDVELLAAMQILQQAYGCETRPACSLLGKEIKKYSPGNLEKLRSGQRKIENPLEQHIFDAFETRLPVSSNAVSLFRIVSSIQELWPVHGMKNEI